MEFYWEKIEDPCQNCGKKNLVADPDTEEKVCASCDTVQDFDNYHLNSKYAGTNIRFGQSDSAPASVVTDSKESKICEAHKVIEGLSSKLGLSRTRCTRVKSLVEQVTEGEYGVGRMFPIVVGACICVVMRMNKRALPVAEVADVVRCDERELGGIINRVVDSLDLKLPEFDVVHTFECWIDKCSIFAGVCRYKVERMLEQGVFLLQCLIKWSVTTGRKPVPVVVAVLVFVAQLNQVPVKIQDVAYELHSGVSTCRLRYKELLERLVKIVRTLPFGKRVTKKNIFKNAPIVIKYMEMNSTTTKSGDTDRLSGLDDVVTNTRRSTRAPKPNLLFGRV